MINVTSSACHLGGLGSMPIIAWNFLDNAKMKQSGIIDENETKTR